MLTLLFIVTSSKSFRDIPAANTVIVMVFREPKINNVFIKLRSSERNADECINESIDEGRSYTNCNIDINDCYFIRLSQFNGKGGVILCENGPFNVRVYFSMFFNCSSSLNSGAIHLSNITNSQLRMICANKCTGANNHFGQFRVTNNNSINYLSVSFCSKIASGVYSFCLVDGNNTICNTNSSLNNARDKSGIAILGDIHLCQFCTFSNNNCSKGCCLYFRLNKSIISYINIVHNNAPDCGVLWLNYNTSLQMYNCIFDMNHDTLFLIQDKSSLVLSHCFVRHTEVPFSRAENATIIYESTIENQKTHLVHFFRSEHCYADNPHLEQTALNTIDITPMITEEETHSITLDRTIQRSPYETPMITEEETHSITLDRTIQRSPYETPMITEEETHSITLDRTIQRSPYETPMITEEETHSITLDRTIQQSPYETPMITEEETHSITLDRTIQRSPYETPMITEEETHSITLDRTIQRSPYETPMITEEETHSITLDRTIQRSPYETPMITEEETHSITLDRTIQRSPYETPMITEEETHSITLDRTIQQSPHETPMIKEEETHSITLDRTIQRSPYETPMITEEETHSITLDRTIQRSPCETPMITEEETHSITLDRTIQQSPHETPMITEEETHSITLDRTIQQSPHETPMTTEEETHSITLDRTIQRSPYETPMITEEETHSITLDRTIQQSPKETIKSSNIWTIPRTYAEIICTCRFDNRKEVNVIFSYSLIILMII